MLMDTLLMPFERSFLFEILDTTINAALVRHHHLVNGDVLLQRFLAVIHTTTFRVNALKPIARVDHILVLIQADGCLEVLTAVIDVTSERLLRRGAAPVCRQTVLIGRLVVAEVAREALEG